MSSPRCKKEKILWQNANPHQAFDAQNITLNSSKYDFLEFYFANCDSTFVCYIKVEKGCGGIASELIGEGAGAYIGYRRRIFRYINDTTYSIGDGMLKYANTSNQADIANTILVPIKVIGY